MKLFSKYKLHLLLLSIVAFFLSWWSFSNSNKNADVERLASRVEQHLQADFVASRVLLNDQAFINDVLADSLTEQTIHVLEESNSIYGVFLQDSLIWWSDYQVDIPSLARFVQPSEPLMRLENGFYKIFSKEHEIEGKLVYTVVLIPVKYQYAIENQYLQSGLTTFQLPADVNFSLTSSPRAKSQAIVKGLAGEKLFYLVRNEETQQKALSPLSTVSFFLLAVLFLLFYLMTLGRAIGKRVGYLTGFFGLAVFLFVARYLSLFVIYPGFLLQSELFSPKYYASSAWAPSLGDLLINVLIILTLSWYFYKCIRFRHEINKIWQKLLGSLFFGAVFAFSYYILEFTDTLVIDSRLSFDVNNFLSIDFYSWLGIVLILLLFASWFFVGQRLITIIRNWFPSNRKAMPYLLLGIILWLGLFIWFSRTPDLLISGSVAILFIVLSFSISRGFPSLSRFYQVILWLSFSALVTSFYLERFNEIKQRENEMLYANLLAQKDYLTEFLFGQIKDEIVTDPFVKNYFKEDYITRKQLEDQINFVYLKGHLSKYDISIKTYKSEKEEQLPARLKKYYALIDSSGRATEISDFYYLSQGPDKLEYLAILRIYEDQEDPVREELLGRLIIEFKTKSIGYSTIYPELLLKEEATPPDLYDRYIYAVYLNGKLVKRTGDFPYPVEYRLKADTRVKEFIKEGAHHLVVKDPSGKTVWISREKRSLLEPFSLFSIILLLNILLFLFITGASLFLRSPQSFWQSLRMEGASFALRIQVLVVGIIFFAFLVIGGVVILNILNEYDEYHQERLIRKSKQILSNLEYLRYESADTAYSWNELLNSVQLKANLSNLSEVHSMDFNIYDRSGFLIESSQPGVFERGLISHLMNPVARHNIYDKRLSLFIHNERIGNLDFLAGYVPILDDQNNLIATVNLPYYAKEKNLREEISNFLVYFINIYVLLLAIAAIFGIVISNSITRPISQLGARMRRIQLGARNVPLQWEKNDEIGRLIAEYNNMLKELEESARLLAQTERESAWREMARQVAHEIKNPLTPMRLSIQHLQRTADQSSSQENDRIKRVCNTLLEQIDQLSHIASEFSNFAKMPRAENEVLNLVEIIESVVNLYDGEASRIELISKVDEVHVFADDKQLNRVFQNLVKNALESIPEEQEGHVEIEISTKYLEGKTFAEVKVRDNGIGITVDEQQKIFQPNFTTKTTGTGLGLPISKKIIEFAGGDITFESEPGNGTTFSVLLPVYEKS